MRSLTHKRDDLGVVTIEVVFALPLLLAFLIAIASFGVFFSKKVDVTSAARDAARTLALHGTPTYPSGMSPKGTVITCAAGDTTNDASVTVQLTGGYNFSIPLIPLGNKPIEATGKMRCGG